MGMRRVRAGVAGRGQELPLSVEGSGMGRPPKTTRHSGEYARPSKQGNMPPEAGEVERNGAQASARTKVEQRSAAFEAVCARGAARSSARSAAGMGEGKPQRYDVEQQTSAQRVSAGMREVWLNAHVTGVDEALPRAGAAHSEVSAVSRSVPAAVVRWQR